MPTGNIAHLDKSGSAGVRAYTLLEVMVALVIMGISISAVAGALSSAKGLSGRANETVEALRVLNNVLNNPPLLRKMAGDEKMTTPLMDDDGWHCTATSEPLVIQSGELQLFSSEAEDSAYQDRKVEAQSEEGEAVEVPGMVRVTLCVSRGESDSDKSVCIERWLLEP